MFLILPYSTESPIYYRPIATGLLIFVNVLVFIVQCNFDCTEYMLQYGDGLHPIQWLTSFFMHGDLGHLIGNMIFLWAFGLVVEGKSGSLTFVLLYLFVGLGVNIVNQLLFLSGDLESSLGASSAIYGLIVISMFWAPQDNLLSLLLAWFLFRIFHLQVKVPLLIAGMIYCLMDFTSALFSGFELSTPFLHVMGIAVGLIPAVVTLYFRLVDCDDRDLFSMFREATGRERTKTRREIAQEQKEIEEHREEVKQQRAVGWRSVDMHLAARNWDAASKQIQRMQRIDAEMDWDEGRLLRIISAFQQIGNSGEVVRYSAIYLRNFSKRQIDVTLNMAKILLTEKHVPKKVIRLIKELNTKQFSQKQTLFARRLVAKARQMIDAGILEIDED